MAYSKEIYGMEYAENSNKLSLKTTLMWLKIFCYFALKAPFFNTSFLRAIVKFYIINRGRPVFIKLVFARIWLNGSNTNAPLNLPLDLQCQEYSLN